MRWLLTGLYVLVAVVYLSGSIFFYVEDRYAWTPEAASAVLTHPVRHPEALMVGARDAMDLNDFSPPVRDVVVDALDELPSFYQPPFLLAAYYANRLEEPEKTRHAFEVAIERFPTNGRLHLAYSRWLFEARTIPPTESSWIAWMEQAKPERLAERHIATAIELEPNLARQGLDILRRQGVAPDRWAAIVPNDTGARVQLLTTLFNEGHRGEALDLLAGMLGEATDGAFLRQASNWALRWGAPGLALEAARRWREWEPATKHEASLAMAKAYLELGETDKAFQTFRDALDEVGPSSRAGLELLCAMGLEYLNRRQVVSAQSLFGEAVTLAPRHVPALLGLARTYLGMGDENEAVEQYKRVLRIDPDNVEAEKELARLLMK